MARRHAKTSKKPERKKYLIVCDGETEVNYCKFVLKPYMHRKYKSVDITVKLFDKACEIQSHIDRCPGSKPYAAVIILKDLEKSNLTPGECEYLHSFEKEKGRRPDASYWFVLYNHPSIEYWYLLHFKSCTTHFDNADAVLRALKRVYPDYDKPMPTSKEEGQVFLANLERAVANLENASLTTPLPYTSQIAPQRQLTNPMSDMNNLLKILKAPINLRNRRCMALKVIFDEINIESRSET